VHLFSHKCHRGKSHFTLYSSGIPHDFLVHGKPATALDVSIWFSIKGQSGGQLQSREEGRGQNMPESSVIVVLIVLACCMAVWCVIFSEYIC